MESEAPKLPPEQTKEELPPVTSDSKKLRSSKPKVRTGCITCKIRHVKCDEAKPECAKCTTTGRKCDGYLEPKLPKPKIKRTRSREPSSTTLILRTPTPEHQLRLHLGTSQERRALEFFFHRTAPQLSGFFSRAFWNGCVLQISMNEPTIRYAMVAVSAMYEDDGLVGQSPVAGLQSHTAFALESYNKAISSLVTVVKANPESIRIPVMASIIFVCLEFLRGHVDSALTHIESGIRMLKAWREKASKYEHDLSAEATFIEDELVPMFGWLNLLSSLFGRPSLDLYSFSSASGYDNHFSPHEPAKTIQQARTMLLDLVNATVKFIQSIGDAKYKSEITMEMLSEQIRLQTFMNDWKRNFEYLRARDASFQDEQIKLGCHLLRAVALTIDIWLAAALYPNETAWDMFKNEYDEIVRLCGMLVVSSVRFPDEMSKRFSFEMGIIPPLHFVAWKCRWPHIRRKALAFLWSSPRRECLFESHRSFACFTKVMLVEEEGLNLPAGQVPGPDQVPPEEARIHQVDIASAQPTPQGHAITFLMKPYGLDGPWHPRTEIVDLSRAEFEPSAFEWIAHDAASPWSQADQTTPSLNLNDLPIMEQTSSLSPAGGSEVAMSAPQWRTQADIEAEVAALFASEQGLNTPMTETGNNHLSRSATPAPVSFEIPRTCAPPSSSLVFRTAGHFDDRY